MSHGNVKYVIDYRVVNFSDILGEEILLFFMPDWNFLLQSARDSSEIFRVGLVDLSTTTKDVFFSFFTRRTNV